MSSIKSSSKEKENQGGIQIDSIDKFDENKGSDSLFNKDKGKSEQDAENMNGINNSDPSQIQDLEYVKENKIKLNQQALQKTPINQNQLEEDSKKSIDPEELTQDIRFSGMRVSPFFTKINRILTIKKKKIIVGVLLFFSVVFFALSICDFLKKVKEQKELKEKTEINNSNKKKNNDSDNGYFMSCKIILILEVVCVTLIMIYHMLNFILSPKENHSIILIAILLLIIFGVIRSILYSSKKISVFTILIYFVYTLLMIIVNSLTLILLIIDAKKNKKNQHNIEEIINFTEINSGIRKDKDNIASNLRNINHNVLVEENDNSSKK